MTDAVFESPLGKLHLRRPNGKSANLKAWDAADELLLQEAGERLAAASHPRILVIDDQFGALTLGLASLGPEVVADSALLSTALVHNVRLNPEISLRTEPRSWLSPPSGPFDAIILRIPRQADYLAWLLRWVNGVLADGGLLLAGGMIKHLPARSVDVFSSAVVTEEVRPARKKARVVVCRPGTETLEGWSGTWQGYDYEGLSVKAMPAVFAREKLDIGTRLFLPHVLESLLLLPVEKRVLDLACGNGVVGLAVLAARPDLDVVFSDVSSQAVLSARHNVFDNFTGLKPTFKHADGIPESSAQFDRIFLNPPFHEGGVVGDHIALRLFAQAARYFGPQGRLLLVGNRHLGYHLSLRKFFRTVRQLDANPKFVVLEASH